MHLAMRATRGRGHGAFSALVRRQHLAAIEQIQHGHLGVGNRIGVVVAVHGLDVGLAILEVEALHLIQPALDQVDRLLVQGRGRAREVDLADHLRRVGRVDHDEIVGRHRTQADRVGGIRLVGPVPLAFRLVHEALIRQQAQDARQAVRTERFILAERQFERRALDVVEQDVQIVGVDQRPLGRCAEEVLGVAHHELIERCAAGH